jgi:tetratricopeptide (TPR) repeat protein
METASSRPGVGIIAVILAVILGFWAVDLFLARTETRETEAEARHYHDSGVALLKAGKADEAVDPLNHAHVLDRDNQDYEMDLAEALLASDKLPEAGSMLSDLLERSPNDGQANLLEARLMLRHKNFREAEAYYHRAIFGIWPGDDEQHRIDVRLELAGVLAGRGDQQALLSELLDFGPQAMENPAVEKKVARWYMQAGSPERAAAVYKSLMKQEPGDKSNAAGYGETELVLGNYRAAEGAFARAGEDARAWVAREVAELDPTVRTLSSAEKFRRSQRVLQMTRDTLAQCHGDPKLVTAADDLLNKKPRGQVTNELAEDRLSLAQDLWDALPPACQPDEVLRLVMNKVEQ